MNRFSTLRLTLGVLLVALCFAAGCRRKAKVDAPALPAPPASTAVTPQEAVAEINRCLELWTFQRNQPPKDLNELVTAGYIQRLPTPPPGQKFQLDPQKMRVQLVSQ
jgi:hypothetical protein